MTNESQANARPAAPTWKRYWPAGVAIFFGLGFSLTVYFSLHAWESRDIQKAFQVEAADRATAIRTVFETQSALLEMVQADFNGLKSIERGEFDKLLVPFQDHACSIVAVEWVPRVAGSRRQEFENAARRDGIDGFKFTELDSNKQLVPAAEREEYFPVYYIGPGPGDPAVYGYDLASEPTRLEAVRKARDTGKAQASGRITFIQDQKVRNGFLILLPVYEQGKPLESVEDRRRNFRGTVVGVFRPNILIETALTRLQPEGIDVALYDSSVAEENKPFYFHASRGRNEPPKDENLVENNGARQSHFHSELKVAGHPWTIECISIPAFAADRQTSWPSITLVAGMAFTAILAAYIMSSIDRRAYSEKLVHEKRLYARGLELKVQERTEELRHAQEEIIQRLVSASLWRDEETGMHIRRTGLLSETLAKAAGWSAAEAELLRQAAPMHDVGKIGIPDSILRKPGKLTPDEFEVIKTHTLIGAEILADSKVPMLQIARQIALNHHEHWDGGGYPSGLSGQEIPEAARIVAIIDVFDAISHDRVYRKAMPFDDIEAIMCEGSGTHFDPGLLALFFTILPDLYQILEEYPNESQSDMLLIRSFASVLAHTNGTEIDAPLAVSADFSLSPG